LLRIKKWSTDTINPEVLTKPEVDFAQLWAYTEAVPFQSFYVWLIGLRLGQGRFL